MQCNTFFMSRITTIYANERARRNWYGILSFTKTSGALPSYCSVFVILITKSIVRKLLKQTSKVYYSNQIPKSFVLIKTRAGVLCGIKMRRAIQMIVGWAEKIMANVLCKSTWIFIEYKESFSAMISFMFSSWIFEVLYLKASYLCVLCVQIFSPVLRFPFYWRIF